MFRFNQDFRALLLGSNKKPETVFLNLVLERTSFPLIKVIIFRKFGFLPGRKNDP